jgi:hypothetical protein
MNQVLTPDFDTSIRPPGYDAIDSQFGFKSVISQVAPDTCFWYPPDCVVSVDENITSPPLSENSTVGLKNPFEYMADWNTTFDQGLENIGRHIPITMTDVMVSALATYDTDATLNQYLHFDYSY